MQTLFNETNIYIYYIYIYCKWWWIYIYTVSGGGGGGGGPPGPKNARADFLSQSSPGSNSRAWCLQRQDHGFDSQGKQELVKCKKKLQRKL